MCWEVGFAIYSTFAPTLHSEYTARPCWPCRSVEDVEVDIAHHLAFQRFCGLRGFASWTFLRFTLCFEFDAKRRKPQKVGHLSAPASRGRAPAVVCNSQHDTHGFLIVRRKRNTETRDRRLKTRGGGETTSQPPALQRTFSPRSRVCGVSLVATDQRFMRIMLTVADRGRARPREAGAGRWPSLIDFCCFRPHQNASEGRFGAMAENGGNRSRVGRPTGVHRRFLHLLHFYTANTVGPYSQKKSGREGAVNREANLPARSPPPAKPLCVL